MTTQRAKQRSRQTDAQAVQQHKISMLSSAWNGLSFLQKSSWITFCALPGVSKVCPFMTFVTVNSTYFAAHGTLLYDAPAVPTVPPPVPPACLELVQSRDGAVSMLLRSPIYAHSVLVYAAPPMPGAQTVPKKRGAWRLLGALPALGEACDLTALYAAKFRGWGVGAKIAVKLVGVSEAGLRSAEQLVCGVVEMAVDVPLVESEIDNAQCVEVITAAVCRFVSAPVRQKGRRSFARRASYYLSAARQLAHAP